MSTTAPLTALNPLMLEAAELLASGRTAGEVKDQLALSVATFEFWRQDPLFHSEVGRLRAERKAETNKTAETAAETAETDALEGALKEQFA